MWNVFKRPETEASADTLNAVLAKEQKRRKDYEAETQRILANIDKMNQIEVLRFIAKTLCRIERK